MAGEAQVPQPAEQAVGTLAPSRMHLVVVTTRALRSEDTGAPGMLVRTRFWHPRDHRWSENDFESLEHARRLFVDESGWVLRQEQSLDGPLTHELIFEARRVDFTRPSREEILRDVGLSPDAVDRMLERVEPRPRSD